MSLIGSVAGALIGIIGATISHSRKMQDINKLLAVIEQQKSEVMRTDASNVQGETSNTSVESELPAAQLGIPTGIPSDNPKAESISEGQIANLLSDTESNLEYKMKLNSLATVVATYSLIAITIPVILKLLSD